MTYIRSFISWLSLSISAWAFCIDVSTYWISASLDEISEFNELGKAFKISYAHGCAFSSDYENCTLRTLFDKADKNMYNNKQAEKAGR